MIGLLTKFLPSSWLLYLLGSVALLAVGFAGGISFRGLLDAPKLAALQHQLDSYQLQVQADTLRANQEYEQKLSEAQARIQSLSQQAKASSNQRQHDSQKLTETLRDPHVIQNPLSDSVKSYLDELRKYQSTANH